MSCRLSVWGIKFRQSVLYCVIPKKQINVLKLYLYRTLSNLPELPNWSARIYFSDSLCCIAGYETHCIDVY